jgi:uncharacterized protein (TIGR02246 family)
MTKQKIHITLSLLVAITSWSISSVAIAATPVVTPATTSSKQQCTHITTTQVAKLFDRWNDSLQTLDPNKVAANYAPDAVLLPTVSNTPRTTPAAIKAYFVDFLKKHPVGTINQRTIRIGCDWASDTGLYTFKLTDGNKTSSVEARYSFVYEEINGQWLIVHHHSSAMPQTDKD